MSEWKLISAKKPSVCEVCNRNVPVGDPIYWSRARSKIRCENDKPIENVEVDGSVVGVAGNSARRKYDSKATWDEDKINARFPKMGRFINLLNDDPQSTMAWRQGAVGEEKFGALLASLSHEHGYVLLNDRRIRGSKANIDHMLVTDKAVFVIDAKNYQGRVSVEFKSLFSQTELLMINGRNQTRLAVGVQKQVALVRTALSDEGVGKAAVQGVMAFLDANWPLIGAPTKIMDIKLNGRKGLVDLIQNHPKVIDLDVKKISNALVKAFPSA